MVRLNTNLRYFQRPPWDTRQSPVELLEFIKSHPAGCALDIGCGTGTNCLTLAQAGWQVCGVDYAWRAIDQARARLTASNLVVNFMAIDITAAKFFDGSFDLVLDIGCYHSFDEPLKKSYRRLVSRWLKPGGYLLLYGHCRSENGLSTTQLTETDIVWFQETLTMVHRKDCEDKWGRKTLWLCFIKPAQ